MPENIVKYYRHLYETKFMRETIEKFPPDLITEAFNGGDGYEFPNHYICLTLQRHRPEYFAVTSITKNSTVHAKVSVSDIHMAKLVDKRSRRKTHLAYEWIQAMLLFLKRAYYDPPRYTLINEVKILFDLLKEHPKHCKNELSDDNQKIHKAIRELFVSAISLEKILININPNVQTLAQMKIFSDKAPSEAYESIILPLTKAFAENWDVEEEIVTSRLQEELGMCA